MSFFGMFQPEMPGHSLREAGSRRVQGSSSGSGLWAYHAIDADFKHEV